MSQPTHLLSSDSPTALAYAFCDIHATQTRKGTSLPYIGHLMAVSAIVH